MPYMKVSCAQKLDDQTKDELAQKLGIALEQIPGKLRSFLICDIEDGKSIFMGGERQTDAVFVDARYFSRQEYHVKDRFTRAVFAAINEVLGTPNERMSMTISEFTGWGGFGDYNDEYYNDKG